MPATRPQYQQPKKIEFKKEPDFNAGKILLITLILHSTFHLFFA